MTVIGDKVVKIAENPFDDTLPFHFCNWQKNPESIWGDGIYYAIRDAQAILNFSYAMMVEGKSLSAAPLTVIDPNAFEPGTDTEQIYPGKQFRVKPGASVRDSFSSVQIPDVTNGLLQVIQQLEREADLDSGQTSIGYGDMSPAQTKTATGMSILNSNANRQTADVVRSVSSMITKNVQAVYRWLMVDSLDATIKGDYEAISTGYEQYVAKEVHNTQLINFLQVIGQFPEIKQYLKPVSMYLKQGLAAVGIEQFSPDIEMPYLSAPGCDLSGRTPTADEDFVGLISEVEKAGWRSTLPDDSTQKEILRNAQVSVYELVEN